MAICFFFPFEYILNFRRKNEKEMYIYVTQTKFCCEKWHLKRFNFHLKNCFVVSYGIIKLRYCLKPCQVFHLLNLLLKWMPSILEVIYFSLMKNTSFLLSNLASNIEKLKVGFAYFFTELQYTNYGTANFF